MQFIMITILAFLSISNACSDSFFSFNNNSVSTGKIIIDGREFGSFDGITGSGVVKKITRNVGRFKSISSTGSFDIVYEKGPFSVEIKGDDNLIDHVLTKVNGDILMLSMNKSYNTRQSLVISISSPDITHFNIAGTSDVTINGINSESLAIDLQGTVDVTVNGSVSKLRLHVQGTGDVSARELIADSANIYLNGSGDIQVTATSELIVKLHGTGDITYFGRPSVVKTDISGVGDIDMGD